MPETIKAILEKGGNVEISDGQYSVEFIRKLLRIAAESGAQVTIHASAFPTEVLLELAALGGGNLTVKFDRP